jgi:hypothetical protein
MHFSHSIGHARFLENVSNLFQHGHSFQMCHVYGHIPLCRSRYGGTLEQMEMTDNCALFEGMQAHFRKSSSKSCEHSGVDSWAQRDGDKNTIGTPAYL